MIYNTYKKAQQNAQKIIAKPDYPCWVHSSIAGRDATRENRSIQAQEKYILFFPVPIAFFVLQKGIEEG